MAGPPFGTASAYSDSFPAPPPRELTVSAETCFNLTVFRDVVRQYRKLDDQVVTRLNRAQAQLRDEARVGKGSSPEGMCAKMWLEMICESGWGRTTGIKEDGANEARPSHADEIPPPASDAVIAKLDAVVLIKAYLTPPAGWTHRQTLLTYCINTVEGSMNAKRAAAGGPTDERLAAAPVRPAGVQGGAHERGVREEQAVSDSLHSESAVEAIVRKRTLEVFKSRCPFFTPPPGRDRGWWDIAESGRMTSSGPE
ncbi:uncharacterized protein LOC62_04G006267 [Vanrija pseudolonga]|uniref:Uncharacterized protein n=1 Tax=Vanrija pseudolonga TaxID=143232 RepID=A0AAF1BIX3_9TREE|nr:hypothetical protein LOC62_04G006267 [Vanrija pseudolonga]